VILRARAVRTRWESFNRQLSAFRLAYDISGGGDCQVVFAFRECSVPTARAGAISGSKSAESKTPSQWNDGSVEAGLRRRLLLLAN